MRSPTTAEAADVGVEKMLHPGHIEYNYCFPVNASLLERGDAANVEPMTGVSTALNAAPASGVLDVAPGPSVEHARVADRSRLLPGLAIDAGCAAIALGRCCG